MTLTGHSFAVWAVAILPEVIVCATFYHHLMMHITGGHHGDSQC